MWLHGTYSCFLIASSLVLISFLSFQIYQHLNIPFAYGEGKTIVRGYRWRLRSNLRRIVIFFKNFKYRIERVQTRFSPAASSRDVIQNRVSSETFLASRRDFFQPRLDAIFFNRVQTQEMFHWRRVLSRSSAAFYTQQNATQTRFYRKKIYMG